MCGAQALVNADGYVTDKSIKNEELKALISSELWKKEDKKKDKKEKEAPKKEETPKK